MIERADEAVGLNGQHGAAEIMDDVLGRIANKTPLKHGRATVPITTRSDPKAWL